jgi:hypothetical protein
MTPFLPIRNHEDPKDLMATLLNEQSPRGKILAFETLLSTLPTSSLGNQSDLGKARGEHLNSDHAQANAVSVDDLSLNGFLRELWQTETDANVTCHYYKRLVDIQVIVTTGAVSDEKADASHCAGLAIISKTTVEAPDIAHAIGSISDSRPTQIQAFEKRSGPKSSGPGRSFASYELCSDPLPDPEHTVIQSSDFYLLGDRSCGAWATCEPISKTPTQVCWKFSMQGHDERPLNSVGMSEGILRYTVAKK